MLAVPDKIILCQEYFVILKYFKNVSTGTIKNEPNHTAYNELWGEEVQCKET